MDQCKIEVASGPVSIPITRSRSDTGAQSKTVHDEPIMRTMSSAAVLGRLAVLEWEDADEMRAKSETFIRGGQEDKPQDVPASNNPDFVRRAKPDPNASPYNKVLCRFSNGEYEVHVSLCYLV